MKTRLAEGPQLTADAKTDAVRVRLSRESVSEAEIEIAVERAWEAILPDLVAWDGATGSIVYRGTPSGAPLVSYSDPGRLVEAVADAAAWTAE